MNCTGTMIQTTLGEPVSWETMSSRLAESEISALVS